MSEEDVAKLSKVCRVNLKPGEERAWNIELNDNSPECREALKEIYSNLGPDSSKFLTNRLTVTDPELKKIVDETK
jgi:hypothetical protein